MIIWAAVKGNNGTTSTLFLPPQEAGADPRLARSALASSFVAALELAKQGKVEIAQDATFAPIMLRRGAA